MTDEFQGKNTKRWGVVAECKFGDEIVYQVSSIHRFKFQAKLECSSMRRVHTEWVDSGLPNLIVGYDVQPVIV